MVLLNLKYFKIYKELIKYLFITEFEIYIAHQIMNYFEIHDSTLNNLGWYILFIYLFIIFKI